MGTDTTQESIPMDAAFGAGCDARLAGKSTSACPFKGDAEAEQRRVWMRGWSHVQDQYGADVKGRWRYRPLPRILIS